MQRLVFKGVASPLPKSSRTDWSKKVKLTVPDQALSLQDIIDRFTRKEPLPVGHSVSWGDDIDIDSPLAVDLEKLLKSDIVDQKEHADRWKEITDRYKVEDQERNRKKAVAAAKKKAEEQEAEIQRRVAEKVNQRSSGSSAV